MHFSATVMFFVSTLRTTTCAMSSIHHTGGKYNSLVTRLHVWIVFEDFPDPLRVKGHIDKHGRTPGDGTPSTVDAHAHYDLALSFLANQRAAVVSLQEMNRYKVRKQKPESFTKVIVGKWFLKIKFLNRTSQTPWSLLPPAQILVSVMGRMPLWLWEHFLLLTMGSPTIFRLPSSPVPITEIKSQLNGRTEQKSATVILYYVKNNSIGKSRYYNRIENTILVQYQTKFIFTGIQ